jgi:hypothetical protein
MIMLLLGFVFQWRRDGGGEDGALSREAAQDAEAATTILLVCAAA